jgi:hypothetical protein
MKTIARIGLGIAAAAFVAAAAGAVEPPNPKDLTQGTWELNVAKSKFCGPAPHKSVRKIFDAGWGLISTIWTGEAADGKPIDNRYVARYDGEKYPAGINSPAAEAISWKLVDPHRLEFTHWSKDDKVTSTYVRTVSADGQTMTQTSKVVGRDCGESQVFDRK